MILTRRVIAADITNLTDARYFAARGVDYLMFDLSTISLDKIIEIKEWVEGPAYILLVTDSSLKFLEEAILKISPAGITTKDQQVLGEIKHYQAHVDILSYEKEEIELDDIIYRHVDSSDGLSELSSEHGIIISGGDEQEVGMKNFDTLDGILDQLEED